MGTDNKQGGVLKPGTVFERYTVEKLLGRGGMGAVYLVRHNVLDSLFALKVLFPNIAVQNGQFVDRFIREAKLACKIRHPNLIAVYDAGKNPDNDMYYIVMDYVSGGSVRDLLQRERRVPPQEALRIVTQMAKALVAAHEHHMVHRDIKPDNIMFDADGTAKLADLGIAKSTDDQDTMLTVASSIFGTPAYMSPEQAMDSSKVDSRADIYSLGIVFYEMLSGERPYRGDSAMQILSQVVAETEVPDIRKVCPQISPDLAELISAMTAKKLAKRIPDPETLLQRLTRINVSPLPDQRDPAPSNFDPPEVTLATEIRRDGGDKAPGHVPAAPGNAAAGAKKIAIRHYGGRELSSKTWKEISSPGPGELRGGPGSAPSAAGPSERTIPTLVETGADREKEALPGPSAAAGPADDAGDVSPARRETPSPTERTIETLRGGGPSGGSPKNPGEPQPPLPLEPDPAVRSADPPHKEPSEPSAECGSRDSLFERKWMFRLACAALVIVIVLSFSSLLLKAGKGAGPIPAVPPAAKEKSPALPSPAAERKKESPPVAGGVKTESAGGVSSKPVPACVPESPEPERKTESPPVAGGVKTESAGDVSAKPVPAHVSGSPAAEISSDPLSRNQIVLLAGTSDGSLALRDLLYRSFGKEKTAFRLAESMGGYKDELRSIIRSSPAAVVIGFADKYAEDRVSKAGFENIIRYHADLLRDSAVPLMFVLFSGDEDDRRLRFFNEAVEEVCKLKSIPLLKYDKRPGADLPQRVKGIMSR